MFTDEERAIFSFNDGERDRKADPLAVRRALVEAADGELYEASVAACEPDRGPDDAPEPGASRVARLRAQGRMVGIVRAGFSLAPIDPDTGKGVTEACCWAIWSAWVRWEAGEKKPVGN